MGRRILNRVEGTSDGESAAVEHVRVDHCRFYVLIPEEILPALVCPGRRTVLGRHK